MCVHIHIHIHIYIYKCVHVDRGRGRERERERESELLLVLWVTQAFLRKDLGLLPLRWIQDSRSTGHGVLDDRSG